MKIGFDAKRAFLNTSGLGNYSRNTLNGLKKFFPDHDYTLFTPDVKEGLFEDHQRFELISPDPSTSAFGKKLWRSFHLSKELEGLGLDVFHGLSNELPGGIHRTGVPTVVTIHDLIFKRYPEFYKPVDRMIYTQKVKYACSAADVILAISEQTKDDLIEFMKADPKKIRVIHQSVSPVFFEDQPVDGIREKYGLPENFILAVGTIEERKNQLSILKALHEQNMDIPLVLVGNPTSYANELHKYMAKTGIEKQVIFLKNIPENDLAALYRLAGLSIYISVFEGFGLPVIESMACGCPVITSDASCLPETAGDAAVLCSPGNVEELGQQIGKILTDSEFKQALVKKGKTRAQEFLPEKYAEKLISLYSEITK